MHNRFLDVTIVVTPLMRVVRNRFFRRHGRGYAPHVESCITVCLDVTIVVTRLGDMPQVVADLTRVVTLSRHCVGDVRILVTLLPKRGGLLELFLRVRERLSCDYWSRQP